MKLKILIAEDSLENVDTLQFILNSLPNDTVKQDVAMTLDDTFSKLNKNEYDLALLDIQFKKGTIFEVLEKLKNENISFPQIIFITAHGSFEYATKAIQFACLDFINKPVNPNHVLGLIKDLISKKRSNESKKEQIMLLLDLIEGDLNSPERIGVIRAKNKIEYINLNQLLYVQANGSTCKFYLTKNTFESVRNLGHYKDLFSENGNIIQINRSCIINKENIKSYSPADRKITMTNNVELIVSHRANNSVKQILNASNSNSLLNKLDKIKKIIFKN